MLQKNSDMECPNPQGRPGCVNDFLPFTPICIIRPSNFFGGPVLPVSAMKPIQVRSAVLHSFRLTYRPFRNGLRLRGLPYVTGQLCPGFTLSTNAPSCHVVQPTDTSCWKLRWTICWGQSAEKPRYRRTCRVRSRHNLEQASGGFINESR